MIFMGAVDTKLWEIVNEDYLQIFFTLGRNNKTDMYTMVNIPFKPFIEIVFVCFWQSLVTTIMAAITSSARGCHPVFLVSLGNQQKHAVLLLSSACYCIS